MDLISSSSDSDEEYVRRRRRRTFRNRINMDFTTYYEYNERFRMSSIKFESLLQDIGNQLHRATNRNEALSPKEQLSIALHWLGNGGQYHAVGDMHGVSKSSVCRVLHSVVRIINIVKFPAAVDWPLDVERVFQQFHAVARMPQVCGCVDGTLINIDAPVNHENDFVDRHGNHSINCMVVCGPDLQFYYASASWPGSVHDARVLRNSTLSERFDDGWRPFQSAVLLGDSGYPLKEWLIPPTLRNLDNPAVVRFKRAHKSTRRLIENAIGVLKEKFPCLNHLRVNPTFAANIFKCCVTLCNISRNIEEQVVMDVEENGDENGHDVMEDPGFDEPPLPSAQRRLQQLINHFA